MTALRLTAAATHGLPKLWCEVTTADCQRLYWRRAHTGYEVHLEGSGRYRAELEWVALSWHDSLTSAMVACREHSHAKNKVVSYVAG